MNRLLNWLAPKKVEVRDIRPVLLNDVEAAKSPHVALDEEVRQARGVFAQEVVRQQRTVADIRMSLTRATLASRRRGLI